MNLLKVKNLGKNYISYKKSWHRLKALLGYSVSDANNKWVLKGISFELYKGDSLGIIGLNGNGKSTLLKIIAGVLSPSSGSVSLNGSIQSILELGMGFDYELSGRQNSYLLSSLSKNQSSKMDKIVCDIESFSELGNYFDEPLYTYSSGMLMRLAFSIVTSDMPDLLIIDEALSVGDAYFQNKCFTKLKEYKKNGGSMLFVSHDMQAVKTLCNQAILLSEGTIKYKGHPSDAFDFYNALISKKESFAIKKNIKTSLNSGIRSGTKQVEIESVTVFSKKKKAQVIEQCSPLKISILVNAKQKTKSWCVGIAIRDKYGNDVYATNTKLIKHTLPDLEEKDVYKIEFDISSLLIGPGFYLISVAVHDLLGHTHGNFDWWDKVSQFEVVSSNPKSSGVCYLNLKCSSNFIK